MQAGEMRVWVGGSLFTVDSMLLVRSCDYFQALFRSGMRECCQGEVRLQGLPVRGFLTALAVSRGERPSLSVDEAVEATECAAFLQARPLAQHLSNLIDSSNCVQLCHAAATFGLWEVFHQAALFIRDMYGDLVEEVCFLPSELREYVESLAPSSFVAMGTHSPSMELLQDSFRNICYLDEDGGEWKHLTDLPIDASTSMAGVAVLDNRLYVVGGVRGVSKQVVNSCFCYDPLSDFWSTFGGPQQPRYNFTLVGHEGRLYAIGGEFQNVVMSSTEVCDLASHSWSSVSPSPWPVAGAACAKAMSRIFVCFWRPMETTDIYEYMPDWDEWRLLTTLIRPQSYGHCMVAHRDNLYVMRNGPSADFLRCLMDCYNLTTGQWSAVHSRYVNSRGALFTAVVRGDSAFTVNRSLTLEYTIGDDRWIPRREMNGFPRSGTVWTFLLRLPQTSRPGTIGTADGALLTRRPSYSRAARHSRHNGHSR
ncbi:kelch repeat and BTB domain-containing protein 13 [Scleropages formosus]|uniref:kelch repeat and BTB domain-containing protein 13 n=1 Tax=Scleropages formosus TaxID=113540 RepID=UPI0008782EBD|nr:kelch repeat and BTB domain-containing protein 13-like [Scleropages formosus]